MFSLLLGLFSVTAESSPPVPQAGAAEALPGLWRESVQVPGLSQVCFALGAVLALIFLLAWAARRFLSGRSYRKGGRGLSVLETLPLGGKRMIQVVRVHDRTLVVGVTGERIDLLTELSEEEPAAVDDAPAEGAGRRRGAKIFPFRADAAAADKPEVHHAER